MKKNEIDKDTKLRSLADLLITTLEDMPANKADEIVASVANEIYTNILGIKGKIVTRRNFSGCIMYRNGDSKSMWDVEAKFVLEPHFEESTDEQ